jgi:hypothetical protein
VKQLAALLPSQLLQQLWTVFFNQVFLESDYDRRRRYKQTESVRNFATMIEHFYDRLVISIASSSENRGERELMMTIKDKSKNKDAKDIVRAQIGSLSEIK